MKTIGLKYKKVPDKSIEVNLPPSKSILNRCLIISFLSGNNLHLNSSRIPYDNVVLQYLLSKIVANKGVGCKLDAKESGTAMRFLISLLSLTPGSWVLDGSERLRQRPVKELIIALKELGADIEFISKPDHIPLMIKGSPVNGGAVDIDGSVSSQYTSSLMLIAPYLPNGLKICLAGRQVSRPYIYMTYKIMKESGADINIDDNIITINKSAYRRGDIPVESDWSAASYWYLISTLLPDKEFVFNNLSVNSLQGDVKCIEFFKDFGICSYTENNTLRIANDNKTVKSLLLDLKDFPDLAPSLIVAAAVKDMTATFSGMSHLKYKESDRLYALSKGLSSMGFNIENNNDTILVHRRSEKLSHAKIMTFDDHRIAMSLMPLSIIIPGLSLDNSDCVMKSYPGFFSDIENIGISIT